MFGYISPVMKSLTEEQQASWRACYCGICHSLRRRYGHMERMCLSHDMTFLAMLLSSLYEPSSAASGSRCALHPLRPHMLYSSSMIDYAADMNLLLFFYKCLDQCEDGAAVSGRLGEKAFRSSMEDVQKRYPRQSQQVEAALTALWKHEKEPSPDPDRLCNLSGNMLGSVFVPDPKDIWAPGLYAVGESLGRFVYWMDAWEDLPSDQKKKRFNPLAAYRDREDYEDFCHDTLELLISEATSHFEMLPLEQDLPILRNVLYSGVWQRYILRKEQIKAKEARRHGK